MDFDYKKYSLENLEKWIEDAINSSEASPQEIYDVIKGVVSDNYYTYKNHTERCYELLALLNGNGNFNLSEVLKEREYYEGVSSEDKILSCDKDDSSPECEGAWNDFWESNNTVEYELREAEYYNQKARLDAEIEEIRNAGGYEWTPNTGSDRVVKWRLPIEAHPSGEYFVQFPDDLLEAVNLKEGDHVEWVDRGDGSYLLRKIDSLMWHPV